MVEGQQPFYRVRIEKSAMTPNDLANVQQYGSPKTLGRDIGAGRARPVGLGMGVRSDTSARRPRMRGRVRNHGSRHRSLRACRGVPGALPQQSRAAGRTPDCVRLEHRQIQVVGHLDVALERSPNCLACAPGSALEACAYRARSGGQERSPRSPRSPTRIGCPQSVASQRSRRVNW